MAVNTDAINTIVNAFVTGNQIAQQSKDRVLQALQLQRMLQNDIETRKFHKSQLDETIRQHDQTFKLGQAQLEEMRQKNIFDATQKFEEAFSLGKVKLGYRDLKPEFVQIDTPEEREAKLSPAGLLAQAQQVLNEDTGAQQRVGPQLPPDMIAQRGGPSQPLVESLINQAARRPMPEETPSALRVVPQNTVEIMPGVRIASDRLVPPKEHRELNPNFALKDAQQEITRLNNELQHLDREEARLSREKMNANTLEMRQYLGELAANVSLQRAQLAADTAMMKAQMMGVQKDNNLNAVRDLGKSFMASPEYRKYPQIFADSKIFERAARDPKSITPLEQGTLLYMIAHYRDLPTGVKDPEIERAKADLINRADRFILSGKSYLGGRDQLTEKGIQDAGKIFSKGMNVHINHMRDMRQTYVNMAKEYTDRMGDPETGKRVLKNFFPITDDPRYVDEEGQPIIGKIDFSKPIVPVK